MANGTRCLMCVVLSLANRVRTAELEIYQARHGSLFHLNRSRLSRHSGCCIVSRAPGCYSYCLQGPYAAFRRVQTLAAAIVTRNCCCSVQQQ